MAIDATQRKQMAGGLVLVATYRKEEYRATVVATEEGKLRYQLADGREFGSPSAAGSAVMGGTACNGWRFWSVEKSTPAKPRAAKAARRPKIRAKPSTSS